MLKIFWSISGSLSPESLLFSSHHLFLLKLFYRLEINGHKKRGSRQDLIWMESKKYNTANIIQRRYKSHSISRNDVFPSSQKRKSKFYSRHMSSRRRSVLSAWTNFPLWKVCAKTGISPTEFKSGTAVRVINHSDHSSCEKVLLKKIFKNFVTKKVFRTRVGSVYLGQNNLQGSPVLCRWNLVSLNIVSNHRGQGGGLKLMRNN